MTSQTSREAYHKEQPLITSQLQQLKDLFRRYPYARFTDRDLQKHFKWEMEVVWSRRAKLVRQGFLVQDGTRVNSTGCRAICHKWRPPQ